MSITSKDYFMGRDVEFAGQLTAAIRANAEEVVVKVNRLLELASRDGISPGTDQYTGTAVASGWRPPAVNARTQNSATGSKHLTAQAVDLQDTPDRDLAQWCLGHERDLVLLGLWMERPQWCAGSIVEGKLVPDPWVHLQVVAPGSGHRCYVPSSAPAPVDLLPGEEAFV